ncbi:hypothetical protein [Methylobacterium sp. GC_Met_2]|uniref:hypothetical protein n=1 Tax=Methylobacterium sp. GC_Met_2 TaxID=2937376 RepID=UPI00226BA747|nr:hypothetical protein [Methylobacterium sp. GC_Met_2]
MPIPSARRAATAAAILIPAAFLMARPASAAPLTLALPGPLPPVQVLTVLAGLHLLGVCFALGLMREFNGTVAYGVLIGFWLAGIGVTSLGAILLWRHLCRRMAAGPRTVARQALVDEAAAPGRS